MIISHVKIIAFQFSLFCKNNRFSKTVFYIINRKIHGCMLAWKYPCSLLFSIYLSVYKSVSVHDKELEIVSDVFQPN